MDRRKFLGAGVGSSLVLTIPASAGMKRLATPPETEGPFYPIVAQTDKDYDLTQIDGHTEVAKGQHIYVNGKVIDTNGEPVANVTVDLWQANAAGRYNHPHDTNPAPVDENFQSWAILKTDIDGRFRIKTVFPGAYPVQKDWTRPPHIHFKITKKGYIEVTTQMYFPDHPLNKIDRLLQRKTEEEQRVMTALLSKHRAETYEYTVIIEKA